MKVSHFLTNFSSGKVSRKLDGRFDVNKLYNSSLREGKNGIINNYGNIFKIPGTYYKFNSHNNSLEVMFPFVFSITDTLVLHFSNGIMRVSKDDSLIQSGGSPYTLTTPYEEQDLYNLKFAQDKDIVYIVDGRHFPRKLTRLANDNWTIELAPLEWGPVMRENLDSSHTLSCSVTSGNGTLTSSIDYFDNDHYSSTEGGAIWLLQDGYVKATAAPTDAKNIPVEVVETLSSTGATDSWSEGAFSVYRGFPNGIAFYESRLFFTGTEFKEKSIWGSRTYSYENFKLDDTDDSALYYEIASSQLNIIKWLHSGKVLGIGSDRGVRNLSTGNSYEALTPDNFYFKTETNIGASSVQPVQIDEAVYYVQNDNKTLREFKYDFQSDAYKSYNMNEISDDIIEGEVIQMAVQQSPFYIIWIVTDEGKLYTLTRNIDQKIMGWTEYETDGDVVSVCITPGAPEDTVYITTKRTINGSIEYHIERFASFAYNDIEDVHYVHDGIFYNGTATTTITGLDHLEGKEVVILADGSTQPSKIVNGGQITLDRAASKVHAGLKYTFEIETLPLEGGSMDGTSQGKKKRLRLLTFRLYKSIGLSVSTDNGDTWTTPPFRYPSMGMGEAIPLFTGDVQIKPEDQITEDLTIMVKSDEPLPLHITGIYGLMYTND